MPPDGSRVAPDEMRVAAFRALYEQHSPAVLAYLLRRCPSPADAQDVLADTFLVAWRRSDVVPDGDKALLWLYAVARRVLANQRRGQRRRDQLLSRLENLRHEHASLEGESGGNVETVLAALSRLSAQDREILLLAAWEGLTHAEIAVVLGCSENASAIRLHRARRRLNLAHGKEEAGSWTHTQEDGDRDTGKGRNG